MSVYRSIARMAAVAALNNHLREPWPTIAGPNVFDSKIEPVEEMRTDRIFPCVVVYTDYDKDHWSKAGRTHGQRLLSFTFELLIVQAAQVGETNTYQLETPSTDSEIELSLDAFEAGILQALDEGTKASDAFNYICPSNVNAISRRGASTEGGLRLAARQMTIEMKAIKEPILGTIPPEIAAFLDELEGFADFGDRVGIIRSLLQRRTGDTSFDRMMHTFGYTRRLTTLLGGQSNPMQVLPPNITFNTTGL